ILCLDGGHRRALWPRSLEQGRQGRASRRRGGMEALPIRVVSGRLSLWRDGATAGRKCDGSPEAGKMTPVVERIVARTPAFPEKAVLGGARVGEAAYVQASAGKG